MLNEATEYEFGIDHEKHLRTGDTLMRMSMTVVALIWNQAALLHKRGSVRFWARPLSSLSVRQSHSAFRL